MPGLRTLSIGVAQEAHWRWYSRGRLRSAFDQPLIGLPRRLNPLPIRSWAGERPPRAEFVFAWRTSQSSSAMPYGMSVRTRSTDSASRRGDLAGRVADDDAGGIGMRSHGRRSYHARPIVGHRPGSGARRLAVARIRPSRAGRAGASDGTAALEETRQGARHERVATPDEDGLRTRPCGGQPVDGDPAVARAGSTTARGSSVTPRPAPTQPMIPSSVPNSTRRTTATRPGQDPLEPLPVRAAGAEDQHLDSAGQGLRLGSGPATRAA